MTDKDLLDELMDQLNKGYEKYKKNHPDFARVVEKEEHKLKGNYRQEKKTTHCKSCGEWLEGSDICSECGMIQK